MSHSPSRSQAAGVRPRAREGFTLLEMVVALAVFSLVALAILHLAGENTRTARHVEDRILAGVIAENLAVDVFATPNPPAVGQTEGVVEMASRRWGWTRTVAPTDQPGVVRIDIAVALDGRQAAALTVVRDEGA